MTHQGLVCAVGVNLLDENINIMKTEIVLDASKEAGVEVNTNPAKCMPIFHD